MVQCVGSRVEAYFSPTDEKPRLVVIGLRDMDRPAVAAALAGADVVVGRRATA